MYRLHYFPGNASMTPHMLLNEIGVPFELVLVDREKNAHKDPAYLRLNPMGRIPTIEDGGLVLFETAAIVLHLCDRHPDVELAPSLGSNARAKFYQWLIFLTNTIQTEQLVYFYPERHTPDPGAVAGVKARSEERLGQMFDVVEAELAKGGPYFLGTKPTAADFYLLMVGRWGRMLAHPPRARPAIGRLMTQLLERPTVQRTLAAEGLAEPFI